MLLHIHKTKILESFTKKKKQKCYKDSIGFTKKITESLIEAGKQHGIWGLGIKMLLYLLGA